jgi:hypothetical protein
MEIFMDVSDCNFTFFVPSFLFHGVEKVDTVRNFICMEIIVVFIFSSVDLNAFREMPQSRYLQTAGAKKLPAVESAKNFNKDISKENKIGK